MVSMVDMSLITIFLFMKIIHYNYYYNSLFS